LLAASLLTLGLSASGARADVRVTVNNAPSRGYFDPWDDRIGFDQVVDPAATDTCKSHEVCLTGDFDGDGDDDVAAFQRGGGGAVYVSLNQGGRLGARQLWHDRFCLWDAVCKVGDVDGDGADDILAFTRGSLGDVWVARSSRRGFGTPEFWHDWFAPWNELPEVADFDGDGRADIVTFAPDGRVWVALSQSTRFSGSRVWLGAWHCSAHGCRAGDFNGDGRADIVTLYQNTSGPHLGRYTAYVAVNTGTNLSPSPTVWSTEIVSAWIEIGQFTSDRWADIVAFFPDGATSELHISNGGSRFIPRQGMPNLCRSGERCKAGRFNADGFSDVFSFY
jgi:hypothetical protein